MNPSFHRSSVDRCWHVKILTFIRKYCEYQEEKKREGFFLSLSLSLSLSLFLARFRSPSLSSRSESMTLRLDRVIIQSSDTHGVAPRFFTSPAIYHFLVGKVSARNGTELVLAKERKAQSFLAPRREWYDTERNGARMHARMHARTQACTHARTNARRWPPLADWREHLYSQETPVADARLWIWWFYVSSETPYKTLVRRNSRFSRFELATLLCAINI